MLNGGTAHPLTGRLGVSLMPIKKVPRRPEAGRNARVVLLILLIALAIAVVVVPRAVRQTKLQADDVSVHSVGPHGVAGRVGLFPATPA